MTGPNNSAAEKRGEVAPGDEWIGIARSGDRSAPPAGIGPAFRVALGALPDFWHQGALTLAASLAFFSLLSFFPLVFLLLSVASSVSHELLGYEYLLSLLQGTLAQ